MAIEIRVPRLAESISEAVVVAWLKQDGEAVAVDEPIATLETDKAAVEIAAEAAGVLRHARKLGETVKVGDVLARVEAGGVTAAPPAPIRGGNGDAGVSLSPAVRRMVEEHGLDPAAIAASGRGGRLLKEDVQRYLESGAANAPETGAGGSAPVARAASPAPTPARGSMPSSAPPAPGMSRSAPVRVAPATTAAPAAGPQAVAWGEHEDERAVPMSRIRQRIAERLVSAQHTAAILTTFNEVDMSAVMELRGRYRESFEKRHGVRLSYMSFFTRACVLALQRIPELNAEIRGTDVVYRRHVHMGIAVQTDRGLVVPVVRDADLRSFADLEKEIARLAAAARENKLMLQELSGGTFSISNGGVFGSLLSTPILNPPQSGILGMHKIEKRPMVVDDQVVIRPMMYLALSYDHRIVDGEQAVTFLVSVKERLEDPERMLLDV